jgi:hypothetical protein
MPRLDGGAELVDTRPVKAQAAVQVRALSVAIAQSAFVPRAAVVQARMAAAPAGRGTRT